MNTPLKARACEATSCLYFGQGQGGLARLEVRTPWSRAEVYLHGAHVTHFQKHDEPPLLFLSEASRFVAGQPIRGGIPVIFPWFGPREGLPAHGFARLNEWVLEAVAWEADGACRLQFRMPRLREWCAERPYAAEYTVRVGRDLQLELKGVNESPRDTFEFEECLHTYFAVADIAHVRVSGLSGTRYLDSLENHAERTDSAESIAVRSEVDRLYVGTEAAVDILDSKHKRRIRVAKSSSRSTVVWNPWIAKSKRMPDFGDEEYLRMICVESGNVGPDRVVLGPGASHRLQVTLDAVPL
jgi:glucose-6-phosphate 1-epimerase